MRFQRSQVVWLALVLCGVGIRAQEALPTFAQEPQVKASAGGATISFAASHACSAEVAVLDAQARIVRHLASGLLGPNAPEPFKKDSLAQELVWDGKNDLGETAVSGPFRVRVGLGLRFKFDKLMGPNPTLPSSSVRALAVNKLGEVFVFHCYNAVHPSDGSLACMVYSREGKYLRTIMPYPANLPEDKLKGVKRIELEPGARVPFLYQAETRSFIPGAGDVENHDALATADGRIVFVGRMEYQRYAQAGPLHAVVIHADGSVPDSGTVKTKIGSGVSATLAFSPDEKTIYASDMRTSKDHYGLPVNVIYTFGLDDKEARPFLGGSKAEGDLALKDPKGICTDKDGQLFVADKGNDRVAVFKPDGSFVGALKTVKPERVAINRKSGAVYVLGGAGINELHKFESWKHSEPMAKLTLPTFKHGGYRVSMSMDDHGDKAVLWLGSHAGGYAKFTVLRIEDAGAAFGKPQDLTTLGGNTSGNAGMLNDLTLDRASETLYADLTQRIEGRTGKRDQNPLKIPPKAYFLGANFAFGLDGNVYLHTSGQQNGVHRFTAGMKLQPFAGTADGYIPNPGSLRLRSRGLTADAQGRVLLLYQKPKPDPGDAQDANCLGLYGADGKPINEKLIDADIRSLNSVRTDYQGNIYMLVGLRPGKEVLPEGLKGKLPEGAKDPDAVMGVNFYPFIYGSVVKFGPEGGAIRKGSAGVHCNFNYNMTTEVKGAKWIVSGASNVPSWRTGTQWMAPDICLCESPRFDVDGFGRSFYPDAARYRVGVLDTNGNMLGTFGSYGNQDSGGPGSAIPQPEIPFCWVQSVAVGDEAVYIGDRLNRRIVRVLLEHAVRKEVAVK